MVAQRISQTEEMSSTRATLSSITPDAAPITIPVMNSDTLPIEPAPRNTPRKRPTRYTGRERLRLAVMWRYWQEGSAIWAAYLPAKRREEEMWETVKAAIERGASRAEIDRLYAQDCNLHTEAERLLECWRQAYRKAWNILDDLRDVWDTIPLNERTAPAETPYAD